MKTKIKGQYKNLLIKYTRRPRQKELVMTFSTINGKEIFEVVVEPDDSDKMLWESNWLTQYISDE